jgi:NUMOD3 motif
MMFIHNKYLDWYCKIIRATQLAGGDRVGYTERHHFVPISLVRLGGLPVENFLTRVTMRKHIILHQLLTRFTTGQAKHKMQFALARCCQARDGRILSSRQVEVGRRAAREASKGDKNPMFGKTAKDYPMVFGRTGDKNPMFGKRWSDERKANASGEKNHMFGRTGDKSPMFGKRWSDERKANASGEKNHMFDNGDKIRGDKNGLFGRTGKNHPMFGKRWSDEWKAKISGDKNGMSGKPSPNRGKPRSEKSKAKYRNTCAQRIATKVIEILVAENPCKVGFLGHAYFELMRNFPTIEEYLEKCENPVKGRRWLANMAHRGFVALIQDQTIGPSVITMDEAPVVLGAGIINSLGLTHHEQGTPCRA